MRPIHFVMLVLVPAAALAVSGCGGDDSLPQIMSADQAREVATQFRERWVKGDLNGVAALARTPFVFRSRDWKTEKDLKENLQLQVPMLKEEFEKADTYEVFSYLDLEKGRWPRGETVPEDKRAAKMTDLGIQREGYLVRLTQGARRGVLLTLNLAEGPRLLVQGIQ